MKNWKILLPVVLLLSTLWFACRDQETDNYQPTADVAFAGRVIDEAGQPIEGAQVRAGNELSITDANGVFRTNFVSLPSRDAKLFVNKIGYFDFSRAFIVNDNALQTVTVQLLRKELAGTISASAGGVVNVPGGVTLNFPAGSVNAQGQIRVFARYLDPSSSDLPLQMPGDLRALNTGGEEGVLATFGMVGVELTDQSGQTVQIASGSEVEITMPIPADKLGVAPASIALWYYDLDEARWVEEGSAEKVGNQYVGKVKHFSFWNCDAFSATVYMDGKVFLGDDQHPIAGAVIRLTVLSNGFQGYGYTDAFGWFGGAVPKDFAMKLEVLIPDQCGGQVIHTQDIGPFQNDVTLPPIIITNLPPQLPIVTVSGILADCNGQPVTYGYAKIELGGQVHTAFVNLNGEFELNTINCGNSNSGTAIGYDLTNFLESAPQDFDIVSGAANLGIVPVCNALSEYIQYTLDGQSVTQIDPSGYIYPDSFSTGTRVSLSAFDSLQLKSIYMSFANGNNQPGTYTLNELYVNNLSVSLAQAANVTTILTATGNVGELIIGTFSGTFTEVNGTSHTITGSYRVIRDQ